jgi:hypothetical protein
VHLFNLTGYSFLFEYLLHQNDKKTVQQLDNGNYNKAELMEIKVPMNLPYYTNRGDYERYDGEMELDGTHYNFVMRKIVGDTLYLFCLPNHAKTDLYKARNDYTAKINDVEPSSHGEKAPKSFVKKDASGTEYYKQIYIYDFLLFPARPKQATIFSSPLSSCFITSPYRPPENIG